MLRRSAIIRQRLLSPLRGLSREGSTCDVVAGTCAPGMIGCSGCSSADGKRNGESGRGTRAQPRYRRLSAIVRVAMRNIRNISPKTYAILVAVLRSSALALISRLIFWNENVSWKMSTPQVPLPGQVSVLGVLPRPPITPARVCAPTSGSARYTTALEAVAGVQYRAATAVVAIIASPAAPAAPAPGDAGATRAIASNCDDPR
ncbi:hypothetical protein B0H15DRAFT_942375 [Mycena belliarum]|uniref:Uncharacterized protein n=1 Tax=Mycena belliarum TaxID=1033014 RepID=A0AAD6UJ04_9AGAR|nr:hypothetical protein B0H15DRAFT_942375 [Mycena belliae]